MININLQRSPKKKIFIFLGICTLLFLIIPNIEFNDPKSTVVFSEEHQLLGARIAQDGQWRFAKTEQLPEKYVQALLQFEDQYFFYHPGVNLISMLRALYLNVKHRQIVSGGSTITMQVARLSRKNPPRTILGKILEMSMALKLELLHSKKSILGMYASAAPFGGNVVGLEAASWRYFNRKPQNLSWGEAAMLAVLPNAPSLIYPGKNSIRLKEKRDALLHKIHKKGLIDELTLQLAIIEPLPNKPLPLPQIANHACDQIHKTHKGKNVQTQIPFSLQKRTNNIVIRHNKRLAENSINNIAALIIEVETGNIKAYIGNTPNPNNTNGGMVDIIPSPRSTGSILKPFLYASMLQFGEILPHTLIKDVPINFAGYSPQNYDLEYNGAVPASDALKRSLNVPAVEMLFQFDEARFLDILRNSYGFSSFTYPADHYGLSLILGGGEASLLELAGAYASMARTLKSYNTHQSYSNSDIFTPSLVNTRKQSNEYNQSATISASSVWFTFEALKQVNRPEDRSGWQNFSSTGNVAWKTGTSFGYRDAWAIGVTADYVVAVWAGNANGEGRPELTGTKAAAPILFDILDLLPQSPWYQKPMNEIYTVKVCAESGFKASSQCPHPQVREIQFSGEKTQVCPYHHIVHLSDDRLWQVNSSCYSTHKMNHDSMLILPPAMEWYYRKKHPEYNVLPPFMDHCKGVQQHQSLELLFPRNLNNLFIPIELNGNQGAVIFEAAHRNMNTKLFWYLDGTFIGSTSQYHQMALSPKPGKHQLEIIDPEGNSLSKSFTVVSKQ